MGDCHVYLNHIEGLKEQLNRSPKPFPRLTIKCPPKNDPSEYDFSDFILQNYTPGFSFPFFLSIYIRLITDFFFFLKKRFVYFP